MIATLPDKEFAVTVRKICWAQLGPLNHLVEASYFINQNFQQKINFLYDSNWLSFLNFVVRGLH